MISEEDYYMTRLHYAVSLHYLPFVITVALSILPSECRQLRLAEEEW
jgi:hypothetical protein